jgi:hypothetical protein
MITMIEGPRNTGKTHLLQQAGIKVYKFPFAKWYDILDLGKDKLAANAFGMGRLILQDLDNQGYIDNIVTDRSIISPLAWGVIEGRMSQKDSYKLLMEMINSGIINSDNKIIYVKGMNPHGRERGDHWDEADYEIEDRMYYHIMETLDKYLGNVIEFENKFDKLSIELFKKIV